MKRYSNFDWLRVIALGMILTCHAARSCVSRIDLPLGAVGNCIFFCMSGLLLGLGWERQGRPIYGIRFVAHRLIRLLVPLWLFFIPYAVYLRMTGYGITLKGVLLNLCLLNWFSKLPGTGIYWFVTAIAVFYLTVLALSRLGRIGQGCKKLWLCLLPIIALMQDGLSAVGIAQGYLLLLLYAGSFAFLFADKIMLTVSKCRPQLAVCVAGALFLVVWVMFYYGFVLPGTSACYWVAMPASFAIGLAVLACFRDLATSGGGAVERLSSVAYEIYLVHSAFLGITPLIVRTPVVHVFVWLALCLFVGIVLNMVSTRLCRKLESLIL